MVGFLYGAGAEDLILVTSCYPSIPPEEFLGPSGPKLETELKMSSRVTSQAAWYRMENGPKSKNGKKLAKNRKWPSAQNGEKMAQKWRKNRKITPNPIFLPFLGHFFPISGRGPFSIFWPIFSHFWISARFPFYTRRPDS